jgi:1-deoxy-D-xylulose-5-phosphate reductoisomerase
VTGIALLGSTGSIGTQTLEVIRAAPDRYELKALAAGHAGDDFDAHLDVLHTASGARVTLFPGNATVPSTSTINFPSGKTRANNAVLALATDASGTLAAQASLSGGGQVDLLVDVNGYLK